MFLLMQLALMSFLQKIQVKLVQIAANMALYTPGALMARGPMLIYLRLSHQPQAVAVLILRLILSWTRPITQAALNPRRILHILMPCACEGLSSPRHVPSPGSLTESFAVNSLNQLSPLVTGVLHGSEVVSSLRSAMTTAPGSSPVPTSPSTRLKHGIRKPKIYTDGTVRYGLFTLDGEPRDHDEALGDTRWKLAMDAEIEALLKNQMWHLVPRKQGANIIDCKWVYKNKEKADGSIDRYKAQFVVNGFKQPY
jgi:hypothetical protein